MMENGGMTSVTRYRKPADSYIDREILLNSEEASSKATEDLKEDDEVYVEDNGWYSMLISWFRIIICFVTMMVMAIICAPIMLVLLPWPYQRIKLGNICGHVTSRLVIWIIGNPVKIEGAEYSKKRAIYISNHASDIDFFLIMWLAPTCAVGIAQKEIIWYPLVGQLYVLANQFRVDRSNRAAAIKSMKQAAKSVVKNNLSLIIFPEGTRSIDGRLLPFKKGFVHLALQTRLPIVPVVMTGAHNALRKGSLRVRPAPVTIKYLPPITTANWTEDKIDEYVNVLHNIYVKHLPKSQKPLSPSI